MIVNLLVFYVLGGIVANALSFDIRLKFFARVVMFLIWPWMFYIERTPRMERWLKWARK